MTALSDADRRAVAGDWMADMSAERHAIPLSKVDVRAAFAAIDAWIDANTAAFNAAIPQPARAALSSREKADLLFRVVRKRFERTA